MTGSSANQTNHRPGADPVVAGLATMPSRLESLRQCVASILPQVDRLHVYLNEFDSVPEWLRHPRVELVRSQEARGDLGDAGKFFRVGDVHGYYLSIDDDIVYPANYAEQLVRRIEDYGRRCCVGLHAALLRPRVESYYRDRDVICWNVPLDLDRAVHVLGTGMLGLHTETLRLSVEDFPTPNMADVWLAVAAQRQQVGMVCIARPANWPRVLPARDSIFRRHRHDDGPQTDAVNSISEWRLHVEVVSPEGEGG